MKSEFKCTDIGLSSALACEGFELLEIRPLDHKTSEFVFEQRDNIDKVAADYWAGRLLVPAHQFNQQLKITKSRLYGQRGYVRN